MGPLHRRRPKNMNGVDMKKVRGKGRIMGRVQKKKERVRVRGRM
jgi:hypothetical protein